MRPAQSPHSRLIPLAIALALAGTASAQLSVTAVSPARNRATASTAAEVTLTFNLSLDPVTVTPTSVSVFGRWSGVVSGAITLENGNRTLRFTPGRPFFAGELVTVDARATLAAIGGGALGRTYTFSFWAQPAPAALAFMLAGTVSARRPNEGSVRSYGGYCGDVDRDGSPDFSVPCEVSNDVRLIKNNGCGAYSSPTLTSLPGGSQPSPNEGADFNGDGWVDFVVSNTGGNTIAVLLNNGSGNYLPAQVYPTGTEPYGCAVLDVDSDGDLDVVVGCATSGNLAIHRNNGNGTFQAATFIDAGGSGERSLATADMNNDGIGDLVVGMFGPNTVNILLGDGAGGFALSGSRACGGSPWMLTVGDINADGNVDVATANSSSGTAGILFGNGAGGLAPAVTYASGSQPIAVDVGDLDGDGLLDLVVSNYSSNTFAYYRNIGGGAFGPRTTMPAQISGSCALLVDYDRDGLLDLVGVDENADIMLLFRHTTPAAAGVQPAICDARMRIDELANHAGYGGVPSHPVTIGGRFFVGVTAPAGSVGLVFASLSAEPGIATPFGLLNLDPIALTFLLSNLTNAAGEARSTVPLPAGLPSGIPVALQTAVTDVTFTRATLTNPEQVVLTP